MSPLKNLDTANRHFVMALIETKRCPLDFYLAMRVSTGCNDGVSLDI
jgi:hypothetical protein